MNYTIKELSESDRPYEKCLKYGAGSLTDAQLLAAIIRTGNGDMNSVALAQEVLHVCSQRDNGLLGLHHTEIPELMEIRGIGKVKAVQIKCVAELSRRIAKATAGEGHYFHCAEEVASYYMEDYRHCDQEHMILLCFSTNGRLLHEKVMTKGTVTQTLVSPREIFREALAYHAVYIILIHNHPSGDPLPSIQDHQLTERMVKVGELLGIPLSDHIILGDRRYYSFFEEANSMINTGDKTC